MYPSTKLVALSLREKFYNKKVKKKTFYGKKKHTSLKDVGVSKATLVQLLWQRACGIISHMFKGPYSLDLL